MRLSSSLSRCLAACLIAVAGPAGAVPASPSTTEATQRLNLESFDYVWSTIRDRHFDPQFGGLDWNGVRDELRPRVARAVTTPGARAVVEEMILRLGLSHFNIIPSDIYAAMEKHDARSPYDGSVGIAARVIDGQALVVSVIEGSPAAAAGVRPGWEILRVGEDDARENLRLIAREYDGSTWKDALLAGAVQSRLEGRIGETITIKFRDGAEREIERWLTMEEARGRKVRFGHLPPFHVWIDTKTVDGEIGYIAFNMFLDPAHLMPAFNDAMRRFLAADGVILDLRGNPGGLTEMAMGMAGWLVKEKDSRLGTVYARDDQLKLIANPRPSTYDGPVAILVDGVTSSTAEFLAGGLKDLGRARIIGERTAGGALTSVIEKLPNGDGFQYALGSFVSARGESLEGHGVVPHLEVGPCRKTLLRGRDPALEAAIAWIRGAK
jgi:carboxyl-terminal processing protease